MLRATVRNFRNSDRLAARMVDPITQTRPPEVPL